MGLRRGVALAAAMALLAALVLGFDARAYDDLTDPVVTHPVDPASCGDLDNPETGIQGDVPKAEQDSGAAEQGYNCGLALVGHTNLGEFGRPATGNANMAWAGRCAYVSSPGAVQGPPMPADGAGVAVVDVSSSTEPRHVGNLRTPGSVSTSETLSALDRPNRPLLVVGQYGNDQVPQRKPMDIYDVSNCAKPKLLETYYWPENIHNLTISPDGRYVFATQPLQVIELLPATLYDNDLMTTGVRPLGNLDDQMEGPMFATGPSADLDDAAPDHVRQASHPSYSSHEAWPVQQDGRTVLYLGGQLPIFEIFTIVDITDWLVGAGPPDVISQRQGRGHSVRTATIGGVPYVLHSEESVFFPSHGCISEEANPFAGPSQPWLTDVSDPAQPVLRSQFGLAINDPENCLTQARSNVRASVHYHDVDDETNTTFVMASMWHSGLRIFDVRDPADPKEVAYFNPGDVQRGAGVKLDHAWGHVRWVPQKNEIWFATADGGFWVLELEPQIRAALGLKPISHEHPDGRPGTDGVTYALPPASSFPVRATTAWYCTIPGGVS